MVNREGAENAISKLRDNELKSAVDIMDAVQRGVIGHEIGAEIGAGNHHDRRHLDESSDDRSDRSSPRFP